MKWSTELSTHLWKTLGLCDSCRTYSSLLIWGLWHRSCQKFFTCEGFPQINFLYKGEPLYGHHALSASNWHGDWAEGCVCVCVYLHLFVCFVFWFFIERVLLHLLLERFLRTRWLTGHTKLQQQFEFWSTDSHLQAVKVCFAINWGRLLEWKCFTTREFRFIPLCWEGIISMTSKP